jgi:hypothetical protein
MNTSDSPESMKNDLLNLEDEYIRLFKEIESVLIAHGFPPYSSNIPLSIAEDWTRNRGYVRFSPLEFRRFFDWEKNNQITSASEGVEPNKVHWSFYKQAQKLKVVSFYYPKYKFTTTPFRYGEHELLVDLFSRLFLCQRRWMTLVIIYHRATWHSRYEDSSKLNMASLEVTKGIMSRRSREAVQQTNSAVTNTDDLTTPKSIDPEHIPSPDRPSPSVETEITSSDVNSDVDEHIDDPSLSEPLPVIPVPWKFYIEHDKGKWCWKLKQAKLARILALLRSEDIFGDISANEIGNYTAMLLSFKEKEINPLSLGSEVRKYKGYETGLDVTELEKKVVRWVLKI